MLTVTVINNLKSEIEFGLKLGNIRDIRLLGEECDGSLLLQINEECDKIVTRIILFNGNQNLIKILHSFADEICLHQATISQDQTILAFVSRIEDAGNSYYQQIQYEVWFLNLETKNFPQCLHIRSYSEITVNFRYYKKLTDSINYYLIISALKKSITLNKIEKNGKDEIQIKNTEAIIQQFYSSQWDAKAQCLYFEHIRLPLGVADSTARLMLTGIQFHDNIHYETVLNVPLELFNSDTHLENQNDKTDVKVKKLTVLTSDSGAVYICQQVTKEQLKENSGKLLYSYNVMILHYGCILRSSVIDEGTFDGGNNNDTKISFLLYSENYILVILPGIFVHLLDVGLQHVPCNNLLIRDENLLPNDMKVLKYCNTIDNPVIVFADELKLATICISPENLLQQMKNELNLSTKIALIHHLIVHYKINEDLTKQLINIIVNESTCLERSQLFQEVLIAKTFSLCEMGFPTDILKLVPITSKKFQSSQIEQKTEISYSTLPHTCLTLSLSQRLRPGDCDTWSNLWMHLQKLRYKQPIPFSPHALRERLMVSMEYITDDESRFSGYNKFDNLQNDGVKLPFSKISDSTCSEYEQVLSLNLREMSMHISKFFMDRSSDLVEEIADEYVSNQVNVSRKLCYFILVAFDENFCHENDFSTENFIALNRIPQLELKRLFSLIRDYHTSVKDISYPLPRGFTAFFAIVAFKCLSHSMFLQYIDRGAIYLHNSVVSYVMNSLDDSEENAEFKLNFITKLPKNKIWRFLEQWDHKYSQEILERLENAAVRRYSSHFVNFNNSTLSDSDNNQQIISSLQQLNRSIKITETYGSINGN